MSFKACLMVFLLIVASIMSGVSRTGASAITSQSSLNASFEETHVISGVPYIAQTEVNYCWYASLAMVLNTMGMNTSLDELLFYVGAGYVHTYRTDQRLPHPGMWGRFDFLRTLFGVTERYWIPQSQNLTNDELWEQYYAGVKENISRDIPVITMVDPFSLPSLRTQFKTNDLIWSLMFAPGHHVIVIVGFNETDQTVCYQDPNAGFYGDGSFGTYAWMSLSLFRQAHEQIDNYAVITYEQTGIPLSKQEAFDEAFRKNIENLTGGSHGYGGCYGINASVRMEVDFSPGVNQSQETSRLYKTYGGTGLIYTVDLVIHWLLSRLDPTYPNIYDIIVAGKQDPFEEIAAAKNHTAQYLAQCVINQSLCRNQSVLLFNESDLWQKLSSSYAVFMRKGMFLSTMRALYVMRSMDARMQDIIHLEEALIMHA